MALKTGLVIKVVISAIKTIMVNSSGEETPKSARTAVFDVVGSSPRIAARQLHLCFNLIAGDHPTLNFPLDNVHCGCILITLSNPL